jgi:hypothetical protein
VRKFAMEPGHANMVAETVWILSPGTRLTPRVHGPRTRGVSRVLRQST